MAEVSYESIQPLIESAKQEGSVMRCVFKCPVSGAKVEAQAGIQSGRGVADVAKKSLKRSMLWRARYGVARLVRSALGYGIAGRVGADVAGSLVEGSLEKKVSTFSDAEKQAAVVQAFENVSSQFVWDGKKKQWMAAATAGDLLTDFAVQMNAAPVAQNYDRKVLARMLVEIAMADGQLAEEEKTFLGEFISPDLGTVGELAKQPRLSAAELAETSRGAPRETMLMISWALACTDKDLAPAEAQRLAEQAQGLQIADSRAAEIRGHAQSFVIDQAMDHIYTGGQLDSSAQAEVYQFADSIGLDRSQVERVEVRYRKRNGLI